MSFLASQSLTINEQTTGQVVCLAGPTTLYQYDRLGRLTQITDPLAQTTQHSWDAHDNLLSLTDAASNTHRFAYSQTGQLLKETGSSHLRV